MRIYPVSKMRSLVINEIFYSLQGETDSVGLPTVFVRLTGCPLRCKYCDTEYAFTDGSKKTFDDIDKSIINYNCNRVTITGGEPLAQSSCIDFLNEYSSKYSLSIETSNAYTIRDINQDVKIILDIKTPGSGEHNKNLIENYSFLKINDQIKFVICNLDDYLWVKEYIKEYDLTEKCPILFSPSYNQMDLETLADKILEDNLPVRLQIQLHKYIWGDIRGK